MRVFIFFSLLATTLAIPQGYNYQQQQKNSFSFGQQHISTSSNGLQDGQNFLQQAIQSPKVSQTLLGGSQQQSFGAQNFIQRPQQSIIPASFGITPQAQQQPIFQQQQQFQQNYNQLAPVVTKDIYVHVAPEEPEERFVQQSLPVAPPRKHYRIVFIKAPTHKISSGAALRLQQAPSEEKTIIYVLTKKPDPLDFETAIQEAAPKPPSKPEVYFIKYKTQEEAQHAQRTIQAQYDKLGGTTQISDEGVAPVSSVIGSLDQPQTSSGSSSFSTGTTGGISSSYGTPLSSGSGANVISNSGSSGLSSSYGAPSSGANAIGSAGVSNVNKYLPPIRI